MKYKELINNEIEEIREATRVLAYIDENMTESSEYVIGQNAILLENLINKYKDEIDLEKANKEAIKLCDDGFNYDDETYDILNEAIESIMDYHKDNIMGDVL